MAVLHLADLHLVRSRRDELEEARRALQAVLAAMEPPQLVLIVGGLFGGPPDPWARAFGNSWLTELAALAPLLLVPGGPEEDPPTEMDLLPRLAARHPIAVPTRAGLWHFGVIQVLACPNPVANPKNLDAVLAPLESPPEGAFSNDNVRILAGPIRLHEARVARHASARGGLSLAELLRAGADLYALGSVHYPQRLDQAVFYPGGLLPHGMLEAGERGGWLHEMAPSRPGVRRSRRGGQEEPPVRSRFLSLAPLAHIVIEATAAQLRDPGTLPHREARGVRIWIRARTSPEELVEVDFRPVRDAFPTARAVRLAPPPVPPPTTSLQPLPPLREALDRWLLGKGIAEALRAAALAAAARLPAGDSAPRPWTLSVRGLKLALRSPVALTIADNGIEERPRPIAFVGEARSGKSLCLIVLAALFGEAPREAIAEGTLSATMEVHAGGSVTLRRSFPERHETDEPTEDSNSRVVPRMVSWPAGDGFLSLSDQERGAYLIASLGYREAAGVLRDIRRALAEIRERAAPDPTKPSLQSVPRDASSPTHLAPVAASLNMRPEGSPAPAAQVGRLDPVFAALQRERDHLRRAIVALTRQSKQLAATTVGAQQVPARSDLLARLYPLLAEYHRAAQVRILCAQELARRDAFREVYRLVTHVASTQDVVRWIVHEGRQAAEASAPLAEGAARAEALALTIEGLLTEGQPEVAGDSEAGLAGAEGDGLDLHRSAIERALHATRALLFDIERALKTLVRLRRSGTDRGERATPPSPTPAPCASADAPASMPPGSVKEMEALALLEETLGPAGLQASFLPEVAAALQGASNELLAGAETGLLVILRPRDQGALNLVAVTPNGTVPATRLSSTEQVLVSEALAAGSGILQAARAGATRGVLIRDEPAAHLGPAIHQQMARLYEQAAARGLQVLTACKPEAPASWHAIPLPSRD